MLKQENKNLFGFKDKLGYLFGDFGNNFTFLLSSGFLLKFYTDVMGVEAAVVGSVMMIARFVDAFTDVAMGRICDKGKVTAAGKFKPWLLRMCIPVAISSFLIYQSSLAKMQITFKVLYLFVTYILWGSFFYTAINIPYGSMASSISAEPDDRQSLSVYRTMGGTLAGVVIGAGIPVIAYETVGDNVLLNGSRFTVIAAVFSVLAVVCYVLCYKLTTERVLSERGESTDKNSVWKMFKNLLKNKALISVIAASVLLLLAQLTMQSMANYVYPNYYRNAAAQAVSNITMLIGMVAAALAAKPTAKKYGKAEISGAASLFAAFICLILFVIRPADVWIYVAVQTLCWFGLGVFSMVSWALITDVIDYSELKNGIREDGTVYAVYSFARKLGQAGAAGISGALLTFIGYSPENAFDSDVINGVYNITLIVPAVSFVLLAVVLWFWYPLKKRTVEQNMRLLKEKNENIG